MFRVQKFGELSKSGFWFRHHLETSVELKKELRSTSYLDFYSKDFMKTIVKVRLNHLGKIVQIGEY